jgi:hypothetical protein
MTFDLRSIMMIGAPHFGHLSPVGFPGSMTVQFG